MSAPFSGIFPRIQACAQGGRWGGVHDLAEVHVAGSGQHVDAVEAALGVGSAGDAIPIVGEYLLHDIVGIVVVVAVFGRLVCNEVIDAVIALEVMIHGLHQLLHGEVMVIEAVVLDGGQAVGYGAYADALNVVGVVPCAARVVVLALLYTVVGQYGEEGAGMYWANICSITLLPATLISTKYFICFL